MTQQTILLECYSPDTTNYTLMSLYASLNSYQTLSVTLTLEVGTRVVSW